MARAVTYTLLLLASQLMLRSSAQTCVNEAILLNYTTLNFFADEVTNATLVCVYSGDLMQIHHGFGGEIIDVLEPGVDDEVRNYKYMLEEFPNYVLRFQPRVHQRHQGMYFCKAPSCNRMSETVFIDVQGAPYLEYRVSVGENNPPTHMTFEEDTAKTLNISFNTFASPQPTVTLYRQQADGTYQPHTDDRITTTNSYVTFSNLLPSDQAIYLISAVNSFGLSINNLTFNLTVKGVGPPTITIDRKIVAPSAYSENYCSDSLDIYEERFCQVKCSVPADAYNELEGTFTLRWEFESAIVPELGTVRQEEYLKADPPHVLLIFSSFDEEMNGEYHCYSNNTHSNDIATVQIIGPPATVEQDPPIISDSSASVSLRWNKPDSFGAEITKYKIQYRRDDISDGQTYMKQLNATDNDPSVTITELCPSGFYVFTVAAVNEFGVTGEFNDGDTAEILDDRCPSEPPSVDATTSEPSSSNDLESTAASQMNLPAIIGGTAAALLIVGLASIVVIGGLFCYLGYVKHSSRRRHAETRWSPPSDYGYEEKSPEPMLNSLSTCIPSLLPATPAYDFCNIDPQYEFPPENLELTDILLDGTYSVIYKANAQGIQEDKTIEVAVKTIKDELMNIEDYVSHMMLEMEQMANIDAHPNVVKLLKVCTVGRPICMVMEYMCHGDLLGFLRATRGHDNMYTVLPGMKETPKLKLTSRDLLNIITQVASGMHFLSENKIVHGHLCARNVLVSTNMEVKVFNVGLYNFHNEETYETTVRWLAPELFGPNTMRTMFGDIWAFGVLMWEVVTLGGTPYAEIKPQEIYPHLFDGMRLQRPPHCAQPVYDMMSQCWSFEPTMRPFFRDIYNALTNLNLSKMSYLDLRNYNDSIYSQFEATEKEPMSVL